MEAARTSVTLVNCYQTTRCYNPEDSNLHTHCRENLKSHLFNIVLKNAIRNIEINPNGTIFNRTKQYLAYADGMVILGRLVRAIEDMLAQLKNTALKASLAINESKTKENENYEKCNSR
jgi:hypothetical protein